MHSWCHTYYQNRHSRSCHRTWTMPHSTCRDWRAPSGWWSSTSPVWSRYPARRLATTSSRSSGTRRSSRTDSTLCWRCMYPSHCALPCVPRCAPAGCRWLRSCCWTCWLCWPGSNPASISSGMAGRWGLFLPSRMGPRSVFRHTNLGSANPWIQLFLGFGRSWLYGLWTVRHKYCCPVLFRELL